jgi:hypothetical protein
VRPTGDVGHSVHVPGDRTSSAAARDMIRDRQWFCDWFSK